MCGTSMEPLAHHALLRSRAQMSWRHDVIAETWQPICRDARLSAHLKQKAVEFPPGDKRRISDGYCRGVAGDFPVHLDVVVTSSIHNHAHEWQVASEGVAVAREERRKLCEWGYDEILGCTAKLVPLAFESQGRWGQSAISELERLARLKGGLLAGSFSPRGSQRRNSQPCAVAPLAQCRAPTRERGHGACCAGQAAARADRCGPAPGRE